MQPFPGGPVAAIAENGYSGCGKGRKDGGGGDQRRERRREGGEKGGVGHGGMK